MTDMTHMNYMTDMKTVGINVYLFHAVPLCIAWVVIFPLSAIIANFRHRFDTWFKLHVSLSVLGLLFTIFGLSVGIMKSEGKHGVLLHRKFGVSFIFILLAQLCLGVYISWKYDPNRMTVPTRDITHWWLGRLCMVWATVTIFIGMEWKHVGIMYIVIVAWALFILFVIYVASVYLHRQERTQDYIYYTEIM